MTDSLLPFTGLTSVTGIVLLIVFVLTGRLFRDAWKARSPYWRLKCVLYGLVALLSFLAIAFIPLKGV